MKKSLDQKLANILADSSCLDFILADAKDADMAFGIAAPGKNQQENRWRTLQEFHDVIRQNVEQGLIDIMLMSASTSELLASKEQLFDSSTVTPAIRANDTTDIWLARGGIYPQQPSLPFASARLSEGNAIGGTDLGLYSVTFNNDPTLDALTLNAYRDFCRDAEQKEFRHFLEVFDPNCPVHPIADVGAYVNDQIARTLAGMTGQRRPLFLKMVYHGPASLEELVSYDSSLIVGILGGSAGTTFDAFHQLWEAKRYGARVALYGRMINNAEHQLSFIQHLRYLADNEITDPIEAVRSYHGELQRLCIRPIRDLDDDLQATKRFIDYAAKSQSVVSNGPGSPARNAAVEVVVAGHICLDVTPTFPQGSSQSPIEPGQLREVGPAAYSTGGCVSNTGLALHQLGISTSLMGKVGDDPFGKQLLNLVNNIDSKLSDGMIVAAGQSTSYSVVISPPGVDRSFLHSPATNDTFSAVDVDLQKVRGAKIFHFGYPPLMKRFWSDGGVEMARLFQSVQQLGTMTSLDMAMPDPGAAVGKIDWRAWLERVLPYVDLFMPSFEEISFMLGRKHSDSFLNSENLRAIADQLLGMGTAIIVLKLGDAGLYMKTSANRDCIVQALRSTKQDVESWVGRELYSPCFEVEVVSTNGAGDRTIAGFLAALVRGADPTITLETAVAVGAVSVERVDMSSNIAPIAIIHNRIQNNWVRKQACTAFKSKSSLPENGCLRGIDDVN
jgi:sugar/nucleoside kinase (ribokinase family)